MSSADNRTYGADIGRFVVPEQPTHTVHDHWSTGRNSRSVFVFAYFESTRIYFEILTLLCSPPAFEN